MTDIKNLKPNKNSKYKQSYFHANNPHKYVGDYNQIICRSSWESRFCQWCDVHPDVKKWGSEPVPIPYRHPISGNMNNYYVDFFLIIERNGTKTSYLAEVKPGKQKYPPDPKMLNEGNRSKRLMRYNAELKTYLINMAKWQSAKQFAESRGMKFIVCDETFLF